MRIVSFKPQSWKLSDISLINDVFGTDIACPTHPTYIQVTLDKNPLIVTDDCIPSLDFNAWSRGALDRKAFIDSKPSIQRMDTKTFITDSAWVNYIYFLYLCSVDTFTFRGAIYRISKCIFTDSSVICVSPV